MFLKKAVESVRALLLFIHKMENQHLNWLDAVCALFRILYKILCGDKISAPKEYNEQMKKSDTMVSLPRNRLNIIGKNYLGNGYNHYIYSGNGCIGVKYSWK